MYNPEAVYWTGENFFADGETELDAFAGEVESELISEEDLQGYSIDDEAEGSFVSDAIFECTGFEKLVEQINSDTAGMSRWEIEDYMEQRIGEFWPALLAAAAPAIIQMAPQVIGAVSSLFSKGSAPRPAAPPPPQPSPPPRPAPKPVARTPVHLSPVRITPRPAVQSNNNAQLINALTGLIQSPAVQQLIGNLASGAQQSINASGGQQINASGVLGVLSSLAGTLAGSLGSESEIPEYAVSESGHFLIDPLDPVQEAELILDLINT